MKARDYFKIAYMLLPKFTTWYFIVMNILTLPMMLISVIPECAGVFPIAVPFFAYTTLFAQFIIPRSGAAPSVKKSLSSAAQAREAQGGSTNIYDMLCVMPITRRQLTSFYMLYYRAYSWICTSISIAVIFISDNEKMPFVALMVILTLFLLNCTNAASMTKLEIPVVILAVILIIAACGFLPLNIFGIIDVTIAVPKTAAVLGMIMLNILFELIMRATQISPKKYYARNGELNS